LKTRKTKMILTPEKVDDFKSAYPSTKNSELAKKYLVKESTIRLWAAQHGIRKEKGWYWEPKEERYVITYYGKAKIDSIASKLGRSKWAVINKYREIVGLRPKWEKKKKAI